MKLVSWNIQGGSNPRVVDAVDRIRPDVAVLVDCMGGRVQRIVAEASEVGYKHHLTSCTDYTGIVMLSVHPLAIGEITNARMPCRWLHAVSEQFALEIVAIYGPLPRTIRGEANMTEFWNWLVSAGDVIVDRKAILCGDFNTGIPGVDGPSDFRFSCVSQFRDLATRGWRDAYRELHPDGRDHSWWNKARGFRIDHCMLSRKHPIALRAAYLQEIDGIRLVKSSSNPSLPAISDHAAMVLET